MTTSAYRGPIMTGMQCEIGGGVWRRDKPFSHMLFFPPKTVSRENRTGGGGWGFGCTINHNASIALGFSASSLLFGKLSGIFSNFFCLFRLRFSHLLFRLRKCFFFRIACKPEWRRMVHTLVNPCRAWQTSIQPPSMLARAFVTLF